VAASSGSIIRELPRALAAFHVAVAARSRSQELQPPMNANAAAIDPRVKRTMRPQNRHIGVHRRSSVAKKSFCLPIIRRVAD
jgi:hypothetical protein